MNNAIARILKRFCCDPGGQELNEQRLEHRDMLTLLRTMEERSRALEACTKDILTLMRLTEERSRTLEYQATQLLAVSNFQNDILQKWYVESVGGVGSFFSKPAITAAGSICLETAHPIAFSSNDHIAPDSTSEGIVRPSLFVRHCIDLLGEDIRCLDLGVGAAGLVFEYVMNDVVAIGLEGSDYCYKHNIGYWPLLLNNLHTCDITHPFRLKYLENNNPVHFHVITMWEVLEHIAEKDVLAVLQNVAAHLEPSSGYFVGSISLLEYVGATGTPYHVTLQPRTWWQQRFAESGLVMLAEHPFDPRLFCRGNGPRFQDIHNYFSNPDAGFHFVARRV